MFKATSMVRYHKKFKSVILPGNRVVCNMPVRYRYIAVESDGGVFAFVTKPFVKTEYEGFTQVTEYWTTRKNRIADHYYLGDIRFKGDWRDSLMKIVKGTAVFVKQNNSEKKL